MSPFNFLWLLFSVIFGGLMPFTELFADKANPEELGKISWFRDLSQALEKAKKEQKAVFILFQEIPG